MERGSEAQAGCAGDSIAQHFIALVEIQLGRCGEYC